MTSDGRYSLRYTRHKQRDIGWFLTGLVGWLVGLVWFGLDWFGLLIGWNPTPRAANLSYAGHVSLQYLQNPFKTIEAILVLTVVLMRLTHDILGVLTAPKNDSKLKFHPAIIIDWLQCCNQLNQGYHLQIHVAVLLALIGICSLNYKIVISLIVLALFIVVECYRCNNHQQ